MENIRDTVKLFEERAKTLMETMKFCEVCDATLIGDGPCKNCAEIKAEAARYAQEKIRRDIKRLGGLRAYEDYTSEKFDNHSYNALKAIEIAKSSQNLYIWGSRGTGKTHLATIIVRDKNEGLIVKPQNMMRFLKEKILDAKREQEEINFFINHTALVIDDLGSEKLSPHTKSLLYEIIDGRYMGKKNGLVVTSNLSPDELAVQMEDDRIMSRLIGMCKVIRLAGIDRRLTA